MKHRPRNDRPAAPPHMPHIQYIEGSLKKPITIVSKAELANLAYCQYKAIETLLTELKRVDPSNALLPGQAAIDAQEDYTVAPPPPAEDDIAQAGQDVSCGIAQAGPIAPYVSQPYVSGLSLAQAWQPLCL